MLVSHSCGSQTQLVEKGDVIHRVSLSSDLDSLDVLTITLKESSGFGGSSDVALQCKLLSIKTCKLCFQSPGH